MKSVLISIQPYWVFLIIARLMGLNIPQEKTVEIRKDYPKASDWNKLAHIYCSKNRKSFNRIPKEYQPLMEKLLGKVIGEFVCNRVDKYDWEYWGDIPNSYADYFYFGAGDDELKQMCLLEEDLNDYGKGKSLYGWNISDLKVYEKPKELGEFITVCKTYYSNNDDKCWGCPNLRVIEGNKEAWQGDCISRHKPLIRPPQSYCYVEEL